MESTIIVIIRAIAACLFLAAFILTIPLYRKTKKKTDIWLLMGAALLVATLESTVNALEWANIMSHTLDSIGEYLSIIFSIIWIYIAYRFLSIK